MDTDGCDGDDLARFEELLFGRSVPELVRVMEYDQRIAKLWDAFESHYSEYDFDLSTAARESGMSKNNLNYLLRRLTGLTFYQLLTRYRVYRSVGMLYTTNCTFTEAALACGIQNSSSYARIFRRILRMPPSVLLPRTEEYRRRIATELLPDPQLQRNASRPRV